MIVVPFIPAHMDGFKAQRSQCLVNKYMAGPDYIDTISEYGPAYTGLVDGKPVIFAGMVCPHPHIGMVWAILSEDCRRHLVAATRRILSFMEAYNTMPRLETAVKRDFKEGHRWVKMLGFVNETPEMGMRNYDLEGQTYDLYARCI
ncbi:MAG: hypothetical protein E6R04_06345 [Spirochaetes bacterium]|nr:MAG: hypothetical protein E6R04_06345 [Spirochaetota bacterium]